MQRGSFRYQSETLTNHLPNIPSNTFPKGDLQTVESNYPRFMDNPPLKCILFEGNIERLRKLIRETPFSFELIVYSGMHALFLTKHKFITERKLFGDFSMTVVRNKACMDAHKKLSSVARNIVALDALMHEEKCYSLKPKNSHQCRTCLSYNAITLQISFLPHVYKICMTTPPVWVTSDHRDCKDYSGPIHHVNDKTFSSFLAFEKYKDVFEEVLLLENPADNAPRLTNIRDQKRQKTNSGGTGIIIGSHLPSGNPRPFILRKHSAALGRARSRISNNDEAERQPDGSQMLPSTQGTKRPKSEGRLLVDENPVTEDAIETSS